MTTRKQLLAAAGILSLCLFAIATTSSRAFDGKSSVTEQLTSADEGATQDVSLLQKKTKKTRRKARGRLPNYYGRVGVSEDQKEKIYAIQATHAEKIAELEKQLKELKAKRDKEVEAVLTPDQLKKVKEMEEEARKKRMERAKKRKKKTTKSKAKDAA